MAQYYNPYSAVSAVAPQYDVGALQRAGALFEKSLNSIRDKEIEDFKLAQEQEKYKNALGFQQRAEERDIAKIAEERAKTLATNNALAVMEDPNVATRLNATASDATSQNALAMYNNANADGVVTPQEQALLDSTYQKDLTRDVLTSGSADQKSLFDARQAVEKLKIQKDENKANADYRLKSLAQQAQSSNLQTKIYNDQRKAIEDQNNVAALILNSMKPIEKDVVNDKYKITQDQLNKANTNISEFEKTNPNLANTSLTPDVVNQFIQERNAILKPNTTPQVPDLLGVGMEDTTAKASVNAKLLEAVGGNKELYNNLLQSNNAEKVLQYVKDKKDLPTLNQNILTTPEKVKQVSPASLEDIRQAILNDPKTNASMKLNILNNLTDDSSGTGLGGLINTTSKSSKSGSTSIGGLFGDGSDSNSLANKKYKENKAGEAEAVKVKLLSIKNNNGSNIPEKTMQEMNAITTAQGMEQYIKNNFTEDFILKDSLAGKQATLSKGLGSILKTTDNDKDSGKNISEFIKLNQDSLSKLNPSQVEDIISKIKTEYGAQTEDSLNNLGSYSPIGDAIDNAVDNWNGMNKNIKLIKP